MRIPEHGSPRSEIVARLAERHAKNVDARAGKLFGYTFLAEPEACQVVEEACRMYMWENALDPTVYPALMEMENELVAMAAQHLGGEAAVGNFTSGGTESIMLAVKTARDWARATRPHVVRPEIVLPITAHAAFQKAAHYLDVGVVLVPVDTESFQVRPEDVRAAVTKNTILIVGSAPSYAHGTIDPIVALAAIAAERGVLCHVDACVGGWLLPFFRELGAPVPDFDFRVPGVTSMSVDLHKYAFAAKGASLVLYRDADLRRHQIFACSSWTGYTIVNPTVQSSKSGAPLAGAWAIVHYLGADGYRRLARGLKEATAEALAGVAGVPGLYVLGQPAMSLFAFAARDLDVFALADELKDRGWHVQPQLGRGRYPDNIHLTIMPTHVPTIGAWVTDLRAAVAAVRARGSSAGAGDLAGLLAGLDPAQLDDAAIDRLVAVVRGGGGMPQHMADINHALNAAPPELADRLLKAYFNAMNRLQE